MTVDSYHLAMYSVCMSLSEIVATKRAALELSRSRLAREVGISANWASMIENEGKLPSDDVIDRLVEVLEDETGAIRIAAATQRGFVAIDLNDDASSTMVKVLLELRRAMPGMSAKKVKALANLLGI